MHKIQLIITLFVEKNKRNLHFFLSFSEGNLWWLILRREDGKVEAAKEVDYEN